MTEAGKIIALWGGVGGAKLVLGLARVLPEDALMVVANTGDDFSHLGLNISPDLDTVVYTLSGLADSERGWGRRDESWTFMSALKGLGGENWFNLGDGDLALHVRRTEALAAGQTLSAFTSEICRILGIGQTILPMTDDAVATIVETPEGPLSFQHYFVRDRCEPAVTGFRFDGIEQARPNSEFHAALVGTDVSAVIVTPSNPFVSVDPILSLPGVRSAIEAFPGPVVAVSPIVGGAAIKGPAAKMMAELGMPATALAVAEHYRDLIDGFVIDEADADAEDAIRALGVSVSVTQSVMRNLDDRKSLARDCLAFAERIGTAR